MDDPRFAHVADLKDINQHTMKEIEHFWLTYKQVQKKVVTIESTRDAAAAKAVVLEAVELYKKEFSKQ